MAGGGRADTERSDRPPLQERGYGQAIASGVVVGGLTTTLGRLAALAVTPLLVVVLGLPLYGFWSIAMVLVGSQSLIDLGLGTVVVRYAAEAAGRRDARALGRLLKLGLAGYAAVSALFAAALVPLAHLLPRWLGVPVAHRSTATLLVYGAAVLFALSNGLVVLTAALQGLQRLDVVGWATLAGQVAYAGAVALTWSRGWGVWGLLGAQGLLFVVPLGWLGRVMAGQLRRWPAAQEPAGDARDGAGATLPSLRTMVSFGGRAQVVAGVDAAVAQLPRLVAATLLGSAAAGQLDLVLRLPTAVMGTPAQALLQPLLPAFARLRSTPEATLALLARGLRGLAAVLVPLSAAVAIAGPALLVRWVGAPGRGLDVPLRLAALGALGYGVAGLANSAALGTGRASLAVRWRLILLGLSILAFPAMAWRWGLGGLAAAFALTSCTVAALAVAQMIRSLGAPAWPTARAALAPGLRALAVAVTTAGLFALAGISPGAWWALPLGTGTLAYVAVAVPLGLVRREEVALVSKLVHLHRRPGRSGRRSPEGERCASAI